MEGIKKRTMTDEADISESFRRTRLRAFVQEHNPCTVNDVSLNSSYVHKFLYLTHPDHIMV
ncbi:hypothetical protein E6C27_scaffold223G00720 [Cucumis melo var. makuwa]|uniref:Uncharacterized protein n=1 Tax=Cucumis melo var. makuwa TaxID=1194695 RepID=A0A5A7SLM7_CUCMM|nr:hypothetical protein E6C27_scaffold223G00720 [Cucumis melo var. makuwa]